MGCDKLRLSLLRDMYPESIFIVFGCVAICVRLVALCSDVVGRSVVFVVGCVSVCVDRGVCERIFVELCFAVCFSCAFAVLWRLCVCFCVGGWCVCFWAGGEAAEE